MPSPLVGTGERAYGSPNLSLEKVLSASEPGASGHHIEGHLGQEVTDTSTALDDGLLSSQLLAGGVCLPSWLGVWVWGGEWGFGKASTLVTQESS